jgi:hypothetical protein
MCESKTTQKVILGGEFRTENAFSPLRSHEKQIPLCVPRPSCSRGTDKKKRGTPFPSRESLRAGGMTATALSLLIVKPTPDAKEWFSHGP